MSRKFTGNKIVVATHNAGKVVEIGALLEPLGTQTVSAGELGLPEPEETGLTFKANAELKALAAATASGLPALADDSGLAVAALNGEPGIYSARWAETEGGRDFGHAMQSVENELQARGATSADKRAAYFVAALTLAWPDGHTETFESHFHGTLVWPPRGNNGFGYDSMFQPDGYDITCGEMDPDQKHAISHRAMAFAQLLPACFGA
ncbi:MAG: RdgB/HAM1 family non-canonical purine NTP pyrophosphatase [Alphaproteobacteria bacterium]|jgi:XTP/dITP diphosphohydrolase|nr:RdgB/HAM1 family non-canonical purine NTP pyrophosphatase [Alphaproteobacteria bacterium]MBT4084877.1 RdgB/HAM1 family non-canonical purine NTP pyrophosphatase [Alphaproteobacteria bacterium]MBT4544833.1 RdgB/HAM1 family non-canonical purine NTP pyrophosphatase [Alphaproteobacteria bacterium]MBT5920413.1 RdgB/HAM1 family non-canonical purine NTP pyrophosphatase [Alphaproteobacteria bacterium]MBT6385682.1 RdgB/HAM1 family non-canonical purine NTP pyrophosphatase [Alphaproteobacteria bacterium